MWPSAEKMMVIPLTVLISFLGWLQPQCLLLDAPFGLGFYVADRFGQWEPGLLWAPNHRVLAVVCGLVWPFIVSAVLSAGMVWSASRLWNEGTGRFRWSAVVLVAAIFSLILSIRVEPGSYFVSYFGYSTANY